jgi:hypothetical protein
MHPNDFEAPEGARRSVPAHLNTANIGKRSFLAEYVRYIHHPRRASGPPQFHGQHKTSDKQSYVTGEWGPARHNQLDWLMEGSLPRVGRHPDI